MKCSICNGAGKLLNDAVCQECKGDGIAPTPRVNCSGCGTPHPAHETARGMCVRCLGEEVAALRNGLSLACQNIGNGSAASENASVHFLAVEVPKEIKLVSDARKREIVVLTRHRDQLSAELDTLRKVTADPAAVWVNILRGSIARPTALDHYEELKAKVGEHETHVCNWREHQPGWAFCGCQVISRPIEMVVQFKFCPFCGGKVEVVVL